MKLCAALLVLVGLSTTTKCQDTGIKLRRRLFDNQNTGGITQKSTPVQNEQSRNLQLVQGLSPRSLSGMGTPKQQTIQPRIGINNNIGMLVQQNGLRQPYPSLSNNVGMVRNGNGITPNMMVQGNMIVPAKSAGPYRYANSQQPNNRQVISQSSSSRVQSNMLQPPQSTVHSGTVMTPQSNNIVLNQQGRSVPLQRQVPYQQRQQPLVQNSQQTGTIQQIQQQQLLRSSSQQVAFPVPFQQQAAFSQQEQLQPSPNGGSLAIQGGGLNMNYASNTPPSGLLARQGAQALPQNNVVGSDIGQMVVPQTSSNNNNNGGNMISQTNSENLVSITQDGTNSTANVLTDENLAGDRQVASIDQETSDQKGGKEPESSENIVQAEKRKEQTTSDDSTERNNGAPSGYNYDPKKIDTSFQGYSQKQTGYMTPSTSTDEIKRTQQSAAASQDTRIIHETGPKIELQSPQSYQSNFALPVTVSVGPNNSNMESYASSIGTDRGDGDIPNEALGRIDESTVNTNLRGSSSSTSSASGSTTITSNSDSQSEASSVSSSMDMVRPVISAGTREGSNNVGTIVETVDEDDEEKDQDVADCKPLEPQEKPVPATWIASFPGSGSRVTWQMIEAITGLYTGDDYDSNGRVEKGFAVAVKTHYPSHTEEKVFRQSIFNGINRSILLIRNPMYALPALFRFVYFIEQKKPHNGEASHHPPVKAWISWRNENFGMEVKAWIGHIQWWLDKYSRANLHLLPFEYLISPERGSDELQKVGEFLGKADPTIADSLIPSNQICCIWDRLVKHDVDIGEEKRLAEASRDRNQLQGLPNPYTVEQLEHMIQVLIRLRDNNKSYPEFYQLMDEYLGDLVDRKKLVNTLSQSNDENERKS